MNFEMGPDVELGLKRTRNYLSDFQYDEAAESLNNLL